MSRTSLKRTLGLTFKRPIISVYRTSRCRFSSSADPEDELPERTPWYLRRDDFSQPPSLKHVEQMPKMPPAAPANLEKICKYLIENLALTDVQIVDLRDTKINNPFGPKAIMIVCSGKSDKHLSRACKDLLTWLRRENKSTPYTEGIISAQLLRVHQRRLKKKAERQSRYSGDYYGGFQANNSPENTFKRTSSWIALDTKVDGIFIHLFSGTRRQELNLEEFWGNEDHLNTRMETETIQSSDPQQANRFQRMFVQPTRRMHSLANQPTEFSEIPLEISINSMKKSIETLKNLREEAHTDPTIRENVTPDSQMVKETLDSFPYNASEELWRLKQIYLAYLRELNPTQFPLSILTDNLLYQQASGIPVDQWDIKFTIERIVYDEHTQKLFQNANVSHAERTKWRQHCDEIFNLILKLHDIAYRSTGKKMFVDDSIVELLAAALVAPANTAVRPEDALKDPKPVVRKENLGSMHIDDRLTSILQLLNTRRDDEPVQRLSKTTAGIILSSYANGGLWQSFWSFWTTLTENVQIETDLRDLMVNTVVKSGAETHIKALFENHLPIMLLSLDEGSVTPEFLAAIEQGLKFIDPDVQKHKYLRRIIDRLRLKEYECM